MRAGPAETPSDWARMLSLCDYTVSDNIVLYRYCVRTFAHNTLACGSMVLYLYCVSFFAPPGRKTTHKELNIIGNRKSYVYRFSPPRRKTRALSGRQGIENDRQATA